jgi:antitoxin VapB
MKPPRKAKTRRTAHSGDQGVRRLGAADERAIAGRDEQTRMRPQASKTRVARHATHKFAGNESAEDLVRKYLDQIGAAEQLASGTRLADVLDQIALDCASLPVLDARPADEIIRFDEHGLPRSDA